MGARVLALQEPVRFSVALKQFEVPRAHVLATVCSRVIQISWRGTYAAADGCGVGNRYASQQELLDAAHGFANRSIPVDVIVIDWMHWKVGSVPSTLYLCRIFPNVRAMLGTQETTADFCRPLLHLFPIFSEPMIHG